MGSSYVAGKHEGRDSRLSGITALEAARCLVTPAVYREVVPLGSKTWYR